MVYVTLDLGSFSIVSSSVHYIEGAFDSSS